MESLATVYTPKFRTDLDVFTLSTWFLKILSTAALYSDEQRSLNKAWPHTVTLQVT